MPPTSSSLYYLIGARISLCLSLPHSNKLILKEEQVAWQVVEKKSRILCKCLNPTLFFFSFFLWWVLIKRIARDKRKGQQKGTCEWKRVQVWNGFVSVAATRPLDRTRKIVILPPPPLFPSRRTGEIRERAGVQRDADSILFIPCVYIYKSLFFFFFAEKNDPLFDVAVQHQMRSSRLFFLKKKENKNYWNSSRAEENFDGVYIWCRCWGGS